VTAAFVIVSGSAPSNLRRSRELSTHVGLPPYAHVLASSSTNSYVTEPITSAPTSS